MKLSEIVYAAPALQKLTMQGMPLRMAYNVAQLVTRCNELLRFYGQQMERIGQMDNADSAETQRAALMNIDADGFDEYEPLRLPLSLPITLSAADVKRLEPLIVFE